MCFIYLLLCFSFVVFFLFVVVFHFWSCVFLSSLCFFLSTLCFLFLWLCLLFGVVFLFCCHVFCCNMFFWCCILLFWIVFPFCDYDWPFRATIRHLSTRLLLLLYSFNTLGFMVIPSHIQTQTKKYTLHKYTHGDVLYMQTQQLNQQSKHTHTHTHIHKHSACASLYTHKAYNLIVINARVHEKFSSVSETSRLLPAVHAGVSATQQPPSSSERNTAGFTQILTCEWKQVQLLGQASPLQTLSHTLAYLQPFQWLAEDMLIGRLNSAVLLPHVTAVSGCEVSGMLCLLPAAKSQILSLLENENEIKANSHRPDCAIIITLFTENMSVEIYMLKRILPAPAGCYSDNYQKQPIRGLNRLTSADILEISLLNVSISIGPKISQKVKFTISAVLLLMMLYSSFDVCSAFQ